MSWRFAKVIYFATVCLPEPLLLFLFPAIYLNYVKFPADFLVYYTFYFWLGLLLLIFELWFSHRQQDAKIVWTILVIVAGIITLPIYWFRHVLRDYQGV
jgi:hypothetical protein